jgi:hypothetical protein
MTLVALDWKQNRLLELHIRPGTDREVIRLALEAAITANPAINYVELVVGMDGKRKVTDRFRKPGQGNWPWDKILENIYKEVSLEERTNSAIKYG